MPITDDEIRDYIDKIAASNVLGRSPRKLFLLEYLIKSELDGRGEALKAYSIGLDVFDKPNDFDPSIDSSVRVEIGRLRTAIALFEASDIAQSTLKVDIPVGTYRPLIRRREEPAKVTQTVVADAPQRAHSFPFFRMALAIMTCIGALTFGIVTILNHDPYQSESNEDFAITLNIEDFKGTEVGKEISSIVKGSFLNNSVVRILDQDSASPTEDSYVFSGRVSDFEGYLRVSAELADLATNKIVWNHVFQVKQDADLQTEIDAQLSSELYTRLFGAAKKSLEARNPKDLTPQQLFILATWVSGPAENSLAWEEKRVDLMKIALSKTPDFGLAHSVLADKYGFLANVYESWDRPEVLELSKTHANRAAELLPLDANVMFNVAQSHWHAGRHAESQRTFVRVTELDPGNSLARFFAHVVPYWCNEVPDDVMNWAITFDENLSSDDPIRWIILTWIATMHTNRGEYELGLEAATRAAQIFQVGYTYMARAMLLNKLGLRSAAAEVIHQQQKNWPGIGPEHFSSSTVPRLCSQNPDPHTFIADYTELSEAMVGKLDR